MKLMSPVLDTFRINVAEEVNYDNNILWHARLFTTVAKQRS
jgi:hypothetical protein